MPKLKPDTQRARREHILDAAELCFARSGFHRTTMQDICRAASVSPGALYVYFNSKEELIAGIVERDRAKFTEQLKELASAPDLMAALEQIAEHYTVDEPHHKRVLNLEMGAESTRNPAIGEIYRSVDNFCLDNIEGLFARARDEGKIAPSMDVRTLAQVLSLIGDGLYWRSAIDPAVDTKALMPAITGLIRTLINPVGTGSGTKAKKAPSRETTP